MSSNPPGSTPDPSPTVAPTAGPTAGPTAAPTPGPAAPKKDAKKGSWGQDIAEALKADPNKPKKDDLKNDFATSMMKQVDGSLDFIMDTAAKIKGRKSELADAAGEKLSELGGSIAKAVSGFISKIKSLGAAESLASDPSSELPATRSGSGSPTDQGRPPVEMVVTRDSNPDPLAAVKASPDPASNSPAENQETTPTPEIAHTTPRLGSSDE